MLLLKVLYVLVLIVLFLLMETSYLFFYEFMLRWLHILEGMEDHIWGNLFQRLVPLLLFTVLFCLFLPSFGITITKWTFFSISCLEWLYMIFIYAKHIVKDESIYPISYSFDFFAAIAIVAHFEYFRLALLP